MKNEWRDVPVSFTVEVNCECDEDGNQTGPWQDLTYEKELPSVVQAELDKLMPGGYEGAELDFDVRSSGYYEPMSMYGGPDHLGWPEEGDDERECLGVYVLLDGKKRIPLSQTSVRHLEELYQEEIQRAELPSLERD